MIRSLILAATAASAMALVTAPAFAGPNETAFLQKLANTWTGQGKLSGAETGPIGCKVVITSATQSARFQGRCAVPDMGQQAFSGSITYNDKLKRYETRSLSSVVPGVRKGNTLVFTTTQRTIAGVGASTMSISPTSLVVDFTLVDKQGAKTTSHVTFTK